MAAAATTVECGATESPGFEESCMDDRTAIHLNLIDNDRFAASWFAVYDGHGNHEASEYLANQLHAQWKRKVDDDGANLTSRTLRNTFREVDTRLCSTLPSMSLLRMSRPLQSSIPLTAPGSTAAVAIIIHMKDTGSTFIQTANCGDSQILWAPSGGRPELLSRVHTLQTDQEDAQRIKDLGGPASSSSGSLHLTRCFGNAYLKKYLIPDPHYSLKQIETEGKLVIATKGLWNAIGPGEAAKIVQSETDGARIASARLCHHAIEKKSQANISVIVTDVVKLPRK